MPYVHEEECVGCNLSELVCPVEGTISMVEEGKGDEVVTWNDRIAAGTELVPGGLDATAKARAEAE